MRTQVLDGASGLALSGTSQLYVLSASGVALVDISNASAPAITVQTEAGAPLGATQGLAVVGDNVAVTSQVQHSVVVLTGVPPDPHRKMPNNFHTSVLAACPAGRRGRTGEVRYRKRGDEDDPANERRDAGDSRGTRCGRWWL